MIHTFLMDLRTLPDPLDCPGWLERLPGQRRTKILRQKHLSLRRQEYGAGLLLNAGLRLAGCPDPGNIQYNKYGKPFVDDFSFNLSHSGDYIILSIWLPRKASGPDREPQNICMRQPSWQGPAGSASRPDKKPLLTVPLQENKPLSCGLLTGCDIEQIKKYKSNIARRFFTETEYRNLEETQDQTAQAELFFRYWTAKESVLKLAGTGMAFPMDIFDVSPGSGAVVDRERAAAWYEALDQKDPDCAGAYEILMNHTLYLKQYRYKDYCITVCGTEDRFCADLEVVNAELLLKSDKIE